MRRLTILLLLAFLPVLILARPALAATAFVQEVVTLTNDAQAAEGLPPLSPESRLSPAALGHAQAITPADFFDHVNPTTGSNLAQRIRAAAYDYLRTAENIAVGQATPQPTPTLTLTATISTTTPLTPTDLVTMTIAAEPLQAHIEEAITVQITLSGQSDSCGQSLVVKPVDVILVLDSSGSMAGEALDAAKQAARAFVNQMDLSQDRVGIVQFSDAVDSTHPLDNDRAAIIAAIDRIHQTGGTAIHNGLQGAFELLQADRRDEATPVIVLLSDGESDATSATHVADTAKAAGVKIVTVGLGNSLNPALMEAIASPDLNGQPQYFNAPTADDLEAIYITIAQNIREYGLASDLILRHQLGLYDFYVVPESLNPSGEIVGDTVTWHQELLEDGDTVFTFQVKGRGQNGDFDIGQLTEAVFLECEQTMRTIALPSGPRVSIIGEALDPPPVPPVCEPWQLFPWWLLLPLLFSLLTLLLLTLTPWGRRLWRRLMNKPLICRLLALLTFLYWLLLLALLARALLSDLCAAERLYFWKITDGGQRIGVYESRFGGDSADPVDELNGNSNCVACHAGSGPTQRLAAVRDDQNGPIIARTVSGQDVPLPLLNGSYIAWSPDGLQMALSLEDQDIYILDLPSGALNPLVGASDPAVIETMPAWAPDGLTIAFVRAAETQADSPASIAVPADIYTVPSAGGVALPLPGASGDGFNYYPAYSPDGLWLAFTRHTAGQNTYADNAADIYLLPSTGGQRIFLRANSEVADSWPSWSPDSRWLGFSSNRRDNQFDVFLVTINAAGQSSDVFILPAAATREDEEHHPVWMPLPEIPWWQRLLDLWPWLLPLLLLLLLGWLFCRERHYELSGQVLNAMTSEPVPGAEVRVAHPVRQVNTPGDGRYRFSLPKGRAMVTASAEGYSSQSQAANIEQDTTLDFRLYPLVDQVDWLEPPPRLPDQPPITVWQPVPTLVIGLGGAGRYVLTHLKKNLLDAGGGILSDRMRLILLDTNDYELLNGQRTPVSFAGVTIEPEEVVEFGDNLEALRPEETELGPELAGWFPRDDYRRRLALHEWDLSAGTRKRRPLVRAAIVRDVKAIWGDDKKERRADGSRLWQLLRQGVENALDDDGRLRVIIVGSLAGGFGGALVADVAYLARRAAAEVTAPAMVSVEGYLVTHNAYSAVSTRRDVHAANTLAALRELERFQLAGGATFRMIYNARAAGDPVLAGEIDWRLLDELYLFDRTPTLPAASDAQARVMSQPAATIYPAMADAITLRLDKASRSGSLNARRQTIQGAVAAQQLATGRAVVGGLGSFVYRVPMYDLVQQLNARWARALLHRLLLGEAGGELRLDPTLNQEYDPRAVADHVHLVLVGLAGYQQPPCPPAVALVGLLAHEGVSPAFAELSAHNPPTDLEHETRDFHAYLTGALAIILNGRQDSSVLAARAAKLGYARYFLEKTIEALGRAAKQGQARPSDSTDLLDQAARVAGQRAEQFADVVRWLGGRLDEQAARLSARLNFQKEQEPANGLYELLGKLEKRHADYLEEMEVIPVRQMIRPAATLKQWEEKYVYNNRITSEALPRLYWRVGSDRAMTLALRAWGDNDIILGNTDEEQAQFLAELLRLASFATQAIWREESLASILQQSGLLTSGLDETAGRLESGSTPLLGWDHAAAGAAQVSTALGVNATVPGGPLLSDALRHQFGGVANLDEVAITDPYTLLFNQMLDVLPLNALISYDDAWHRYRDWYGLIPGRQANAQAEPTAVFQAERVALQLEQRLQPELGLEARMLRPIIVIALDNGGVARLYILALAAGFVTPTAEGVEIRLPDGQVISVRLSADERARPRLNGLLHFVISAKGREAAALQAAVQVADTATVAQWQVWSGSGWANLPLARQLEAEGDDGKELAIVTALYCRRALHERQQP